MPGRAGEPHACGIVALLEVTIDREIGRICCRWISPGPDACIAAAGRLETEVSVWDRS
jgi:hypothetical protein